MFHTTQLTRGLTRAPGFAFSVVLLLGLGVGAVTFIVAVTYGVLLRPLPFADESRLVTLANTIPAASVGGFPFSPTEYVEHRDHNKAFTGVAAYAAANVTLINGGAAERVAAARVTANYFDVIGARVAAGRAFEPADGQPGVECVVVLRHGFWQVRLGGVPNVIGQPLVIDDRSCRVIGITATDFRWPATADAWLPLAVPASPGASALGRQSYRPIARLAAGVTPEQARGETRSLAARFYARHPSFYSGSAWEITLTPIREQVLGNVSRMLIFLAGAVALIFAIACANIMQLMLARLLARDREFVIRRALGAGMRQVLAQLGAECAVLGAAGGALGFGLASVGVNALLASSSLPLPRRESIAIDGAMIASALAATIAGVVAMALPAVMRIMTTRIVSVVAAGRFGPSVTVRRAREALVAVQVALTMTLVVGAALFTTSLQRLTSVQPGFESRDRIVAQVSPPPSRYPDAARASAVFRDIVDRVAALPGVMAVGGVSALPLSGQDPRASFVIDGWTPDQKAKATEVHYRLVAGDYFRAMGVRLAHGRWPAPTDGRSAPPIAVVNEAFARRFWSATGGAIGHRVSVDDGATWHTIVGVVADIKHAGLDAGEDIELFLPSEQTSAPGATAMTLVVHSELPIDSVAASLRHVVAQADPRLPVFSVRTLDDVIDASVATPWLRTVVIGLFALVALLLAAVGTFSVLAQFVGERTYEIAVRRALGAQPSAIASLVIGRGAVVLGAGVVLGAAGAGALSGFVGAFLFGIDASDPAAYLSALTVVATVGGLACLVPLWRAVRVSPLVQLRAD